MAAARLKAGSGAGAQLPQLPGTSRARHGSPNVGLTAIPSPMASEQPGRGLGMDNGDARAVACSQALWLVASEQKNP